MRSKKYVVYIVVMLLIIVTLGVSYSYFVGTNSINKKEINISSKKIAIIFTDTVELVETSIEPGWSTSKSFSVENKSNDVFNYNIVIKNLINTFVTEGFLQYKITSDTGYNMTDYVDVPKSAERKDVTLVYDIDIESGSKHEYTIEFIYKNSEEVDQSVDMGKEFGGTLAIAEGSVDPNKFYSVTLNMENGIINGENPKETIKNGSVSFDYTLNEGYNLGSLSCDGGASIEENNGKIVVSNVKTNQICTANTSKKTYTWEMKITNGKTDALNRIVEYGGEAIFNITPNTGYTLEGALLSEGCILEGNTVKVSDVRSNGVCEVTLAKAKYSVSLSGENVTVSDSPKEVEYLGSTTFTVSPKTGYNLNNATVNCDNGASATLNGTTVTVSNITNNTVCTITPILNTYSLTVKVVNGTGGSTKTVSHGGSTTYTLTASTGYTLTSPTISCGGSATGSISGSTLTIRNVTATQTCTVTLKKKTYTVSVGTNSSTMGTVTPGSQVIEHGKSATVTISPKSGYKYSSNNCGGSVSGNTMTISNITAAKSCTVTFETLATLKGKLLADNPTILTRTDFSQIFTDSNTGTLYKANGNLTEGGKDVYYFAGNAQNNWVKFGKDQDGADLYWRIIRTNEDGGVRLLYIGPDKATTNAFIKIDGKYMSGGSNTTGMYNSQHDDTMYVGYMYGTIGSLSRNRRNTTSAPIKTVTDKWYSKTINVKTDGTYTYDKYVSETAIYCNDRAGENYSSSEAMFYAANFRIPKNPSYKCGNDPNRNLYTDASNADKFTKSSTTGNGQLTYPIAQITVDEIAFAGGKYGTNAPAWYYYNSTGGSAVGSGMWWTMSPKFANNDVDVFVFSVYGSGRPGYLSTYNVWDSYPGVRPVLSLKSCVTYVSGDGSPNNPYTVSLNSTCSNAEN